MTVTADAQLAGIFDRMAAEGWAVAKNRLNASEVHTARTLIAAHFQAGQGTLIEGARVQPAAAHLVPGLS